MALPEVGLQAVIENLAGFEKGIKVINDGYNTVNTGAKSVEKASASLGSSITNLGGTMLSFGTKAVVAAGVGLAGLATGLVAAGASAISAGSDVAEMQSKFNAVFKEEAPAARAELEALAEQIGRNKYDLQGFAATLQDTFVPLGFARDEASDMSIELVKLAEDLGSFNNIPTDLVIQDLQSALVGNTETLRKYGVVANETAIKQFAMANGLADTAVDAGKVQKAQVALEKAQIAYNKALQGGSVDSDALRKRQISLEKAQMSYNEAIAKYGADSSQAKKAALSLETAQINYNNAAQGGGVDTDRLRIAELNLQAAQNKLNEAMEGGTVELNAQQKAQAILGITLASTTDAQGDAARTAGGWANQMRALQATIEETWQEIGLQLLPVVEPLLQRFTAMAREVLPQLTAAFSDKVIPAIKSVFNVFDLLVTGDFKGGIFGLSEDSALIDFLFDVREGIISVYEFARLLVTRDFEGGLFGLFEDETGPLFDFRDALVELFNTIFNVGGTIFDPLTNAYDNARVSLGDLINSGFKFLVDNVFPALTTAIEFVTENWEAFKGAIMGVAAVLAGAAVVAAIVGIGSALAALVSPIGLIITAAALLGAAWNTNFLGIQDRVKEFWKAAEPILKDVWEWLKKNIPKAIDTLEKAFKPLITKVLPELLDIFDIINKWVQKNWPLIKKTIATVIDFLYDLFKSFTKDTSKFWDEWGDILIKYTDFIFNTIFKLVKTGLENMLDIITLIMQIITGDWKGAWETIQKITDRSISTIISIVEDGFEIMLSVISKIMGSVLSTLTSIWNNIVSTIKSKVDDVINAVKSGFNQLPGIISGMASQLYNAARTMMQGAINGITSMLSNLINALTSTVQNAVNTLLSAITGGSIYSTLISIGQNIINKIRDGINTAVSLAITLRDKIAGWINEVASTAGAIWTAAYNLGKAIIAKIIDGIEAVTSFANDLKITISNWLTSIVNNLGGIASSAFAMGRKIVDNLLSGIGSMANTFINWVRDKFDEWLGNVFSPIPAAQHMGEKIVDNVLLGLANQKGGFISAVKNNLSDWIAVAGAGATIGITPQLAGAAAFGGFNTPVSATPTAGSSGQTIINNNVFNLGGNNISGGMDAAQFEAGVLNVIRRSLA